MVSGLRAARPCSKELTICRSKTHRTAAGLLARIQENDLFLLTSHQKAKTSLLKQGNAGLAAAGERGKVQTSSYQQKVKSSRLCGSLLPYSRSISSPQTFNWHILINLKERKTETISYYVKYTSLEISLPVCKHVYNTGYNYCLSYTGDPVYLTTANCCKAKLTTNAMVFTVTTVITVFPSSMTGKLFSPSFTNEEITSNAVEVLISSKRYFPNPKRRELLSCAHYHANALKLTCDWL